jgi:FKBP-type peptidyl-prolyl cis-trans isomerase SlpA
MSLTLSLADGTVVDTTEGEEPLTLTIGDGSLHASLERLLTGLAAGDTVHRRLAPEDAYGPRDPTNVHLLPRSDFPSDMALAPGVIVGFTTPAGHEVAGTVIELADDGVRVDFNHPLSGREIEIAVRILGVD